MNRKEEHRSGALGFLFTIAVAFTILKYAPAALGITGFGLFGLAAAGGLAAFLLVIVYDHWRNN